MNWADDPKVRVELDAMMDAPRAPSPTDAERIAAMTDAIRQMADGLPAGVLAFADASLLEDLVERCMVKLWPKLVEAYGDRVDHHVCSMLLGVGVGAGYAIGEHVGAQRGRS